MIHLDSIQKAASQLIEQPDAQHPEQLANLHRALHQLNRDLETQLALYRTFLRNLREAKESDESKITTERDSIRRAFEAIGPLLGHCRWSYLDKLKSVFERHFCADCFRLFDELKSHHDYIALQGCLGKTLPLKLLCDAALTKKDENNALLSFASELNSKRVPIAILHNGLKGIIDIAQKQNPYLHYDLEALEEILYDQSLFENDDPAFIQRDLQPGTLVKTQRDGQTHEFKLGQQLGAPSRNRYFYINRYTRTTPTSTLDALLEKTEGGVDQEETEKLLLWFPPNAALPGIARRKALRQRAEEIDHYVPLNCPLFIDPRGHFCLVEKLPLQLGSSLWFQSLPTYLPTVITWLKWLTDQSISLTYLKPEYLHFDKEDSLTAVKEMSPLSYDVLTMEQFAWKIGGGNPLLYRQILDGVGIPQHPYALFIRQAILYDLARDAIMQKAASESIPELVQDSALASLQSLRQLKNDCRETVLRSGGSALLIDRLVTQLHLETGSSALILSEFIKAKALQK